ncbi:uncharacterized protein B0H18DRAFT_988593, partial [Fomitopsis serialis]|uniref:uncharacterized protein n=1 Tax=Fomitopsis serialis TaxID=139415 RepID=UPI0020088245
MGFYSGPSRTSTYVPPASSLARCLPPRGHLKLAAHLAQDICAPARRCRCSPSSRRLAPCTLVFTTHSPQSCLPATLIRAPCTPRRSRLVIPTRPRRHSLCVAPPSRCTARRQAPFPSSTPRATVPPTTAVTHHEGLSRIHATSSRSPPTSATCNGHPPLRPGSHRVQPSRDVIHSAATSTFTASAMAAALVTLMATSAGMGKDDSGSGRDDVENDTSKTMNRCTL